MPVGCAPQTYYDEGTEMYRPCHVICDGLEYSETTRWECADYCEGKREEGEKERKGIGLLGLGFEGWLGLNLIKMFM